MEERPSALNRASGVNRDFPLGFLRTISMVTFPDSRPTTNICNSYLLLCAIVSELNQVMVDGAWQTATALPWGKGRCFCIFCRVAREVAAMGSGVFLLSKIPELKPRNRRNTLKCRSFANGNRSTTEGSFWGRRTPFRAFAFAWFALVRGLAQWRFQGLLAQAEE